MTGYSAVKDVFFDNHVSPARQDLSAIQELRQMAPEISILILTATSQSDFVVAALKAGATGYFPKSGPVRDLLRTIREVAQGDWAVPPKIARCMMQKWPTSVLAKRVEPLTPVELKVLALLARGWPNQLIADTVGIAEQTVRTHVTRILSKLKVTNRTTAALYALRTGIVHLDEVGSDLESMRMTFPG